MPPPVPPPHAARRLVQLDVLRGVAILLVIGHHTVMDPPPGVAGAVARYWAWVGWTGVDLFFVLSGFLVGGLLFSEIKRDGRLDVRRFLVRRGFKIWPSYYLYMAYVFVALAWRAHYGVGPAFREIWPNLLNVQNYAWHGDLPIVLPHTWSLAVEEHFYLLLPVALLVICTGGGSRRLRQWFPLLGVAVIAGCLAMRLAVSAGPRDDLMVWSERHQFPTHLRLDGLFVGVWVAYAVHLRPTILSALARPRVAVAAVAVGVAVVVAATWPSRTDRFVYTAGYTLIAVGFAAVVAAVSILPATANRATRAIWSSWPARAVAFVGTYSYSTYLWHVAIGQKVPNWLVGHHLLAGWPSTQWVAVMAVYIGGSVAVGVVLAKLIEFPALAIRDQLFPSRVATVSPVAHSVRADPFILGDVPAVTTP